MMGCSGNQKYTKNSDGKLLLKQLLKRLGKKEGNIKTDLWEMQQILFNEDTKGLDYLAPIKWLDQIYVVAP
jgi:hypothetical protein